MMVEKASNRYDKAVEQAEKKAERAHALALEDKRHNQRMAELAEESKRTPAAASASASASSSLFTLTDFNPDKEDFETYVKSFELIATNTSLPKALWAHCL